MYNTQIIVEKIKGQLKAKNCTAKKMMADLSFGVNTLTELSKGKIMSCIRLAEIADYLDCSVDYLLGREKGTEMELSNKEIKLINTYREEADLQIAVDRILKIDQQ